MRVLLVGILGLVAALNSPLSAEENWFQYRRPIVAHELQEDELLAVPLDTDIFAATRSDLLDLRLYADNGDPVAFLRRKVRDTSANDVTTTWTAKDPAVKLTGDGGLEVEVVLDEKDPRPNGIRLITPLKNFEQRVRVFSAADKADWQIAGEETVVFDYSRFMDVRNDRIEFPASPHRRFRVVVDNITAQQESELLELTRRLKGDTEAERLENVTVKRRPFRIDRIEFFRKSTKQQAGKLQAHNYQVANFEVSQDDENRQTVVSVKMQDQPLTALAVQTPGRNFSRHAVVECEVAQSPTDKWTELTATTLSRIDFKNIQQEQLKLSFHETRNTRYRIRIDNGDNPPLEINGIEAEGPLYELVFLASPGRKYHLAYGAKTVEAASLDTAAVQQLLGKGFEPVSVELGKPESNPDASASPLNWSRILFHPVLLGTVVLLLVLALGWSLYHASRRLEGMDEQQTPPVPPAENAVPNPPETPREQ